MFKFVLTILIFQSILFSLNVNQETTFNELLSHAEIYKDLNRSENISSIQKKNFVPIKKQHLGCGYSPKYNVWIRFTLTNDTSHEVHKIIEYANPLTSYVTFFEGDILKKEDGLLHVPTEKMSLNPNLEITLAPHQSKLFYIKASSTVTTLIVELNLWNSYTFHKKEMKHLALLALFFGMILITILYNTLNFLKTKKLSYLYYALFFLTFSLYHLLYRGVATVLFPPELLSFFIHYSSVVVALPTIFLALFTQALLQLKQYPKLNKLLNYVLLFYPMVILTIHATHAYQYRSIYPTFTLFLLLFMTIYALIKRNRQAPFAMMGWVLFVASALFMYLSSVGSFNAFHFIPYLVELLLVLVVAVFSFALASKLQEGEEERVSRKKSELNLKELKHRVSNNMQTFCNLVSFQKDSIDDKETQTMLTSLEERILLTSEIFTLLEEKNPHELVEVADFFSLTTNQLQKIYKKEKITIEIETNVKMSVKNTLYCCQILSEAVSNSFKYAFNDVERGEIKVFLKERKKEYHLRIQDNGKGFNTRREKGLGLGIIEELATLQLDGKLEMKSKKGVQIDVRWHKNKR